MKDTERGRDTGRGRSRLHAGSLMQDSISEPRDHALSQRQMPNHWATQASHGNSYSLNFTLVTSSHSFGFNITYKCPNALSPEPIPSYFST